MAAQPKRRASTYRKGKRFATKSKTSVTPQACSHCGQPKLAHRLCKNCGKK